MRVLNRILRITDKGVEYEADQRHAELVIKQLDLEKANGVLTPVDDEVENKLMDDQGRNMQDVCDGDYAALYKLVATQLNYLSLDRPDCQFSIKEVCRRMADPTWRDIARLKMFGIYLVTRPILVLKFEFQGQRERERERERVNVTINANWAGCRATRTNPVEDAYF